MRAKMTFRQFRDLFQSHLESMIVGASRLYELDLDKDKLWETYLESFPADANVIFRKRREFDCSCCRHFIKQFGHVVAIRDNAMVSVWDFTVDDPVYQQVLSSLSAFVHTHQIADVFYTKIGHLGTAMSIDRGEMLDNERTLRWNHFTADLPVRFVMKGAVSEGEYKGAQRDLRNVFKRSLEEISEDAVDTVLELIASHSLYRGEEWWNQLRSFKVYQGEYKALSDEQKGLYAWVKSGEVGAAIAKIRNHSIGVLLTDITEGMDLETAVKRYEKIVAPANYKRPKAIFTQRMLEDAQRKVTELGYMASLPRRYARLNDISVNNILFCNRDVAPQVQGSDVFAAMSAEATRKPMRFDRVEEISAKDFIENILPTAQSVEVYLENRHKQNVVSLIAPQNMDAPSMFKWANPFGWAYAGNMTDSDITQRVREAGGRTDGVLRFSHSWNYEGMRNTSLMDLHVFLPGWDGKGTVGVREVHDNYGNNQRVGWNHRRHIASGGVQDVDYTAQAPQGYIPVENTVFPDMDKLKEGVYIFKIHNWDFRHPTTGGFKAELAFDGQVYNFERREPLQHKEWITVAKLELKNGQFRILEMMDSDMTPTSIAGVQSNQFVPVSVAMFSPNYWDEQDGIGHRHVFFMLKGMRNSESPNGFYNEFLKQELVQHKHVFEALGSRMRVEDSDDQLTGLGFSTSKRNDLIVRVTGATKRVLKVKF